MCDHNDWMKICVLCGDVLETTENKSDTIASSEMSETIYVPVQQSVERTATPWTCGECGYRNNGFHKVCGGCKTPRR